MLKSPASNWCNYQEEPLLHLAISPCPNDTFAFYGLLEGKTSLKQPLKTTYADIEELNHLCMGLQPPQICKISFHAYLYLKDRFQLLDAGSALGFGCGPLLVTKQAMTEAQISQATIGIPGTWTTAALLLKLRYGPKLHLRVMRFDKIMPAVAAGELDAGLIIHESRFTYPNYGLHCLLDLGDWWEQETGCAIPLGGIVASRQLSSEAIRAIDCALGESIDYAWANPEAVTPFMQQHAQEMDPQVMHHHVALYVNERTRSLGVEGHKALDALWQKAKEQGLLDSMPPTPEQG